VRLRDLDARFIHEATKAGCRLSYRDNVQGMQGVMFQCPKCGEGLERGKKGRRRFIRGAHYIRVFFSNPVGVEVAPPDADLRNDGSPNPRWEMTGATIEDLTLKPSINCDIPWKDKQGVEHQSSCKFHGFVTSGDVA